MSHESGRPRVNRRLYKGYMCTLARGPLFGTISYFNMLNSVALLACASYSCGVVNGCGLFSPFTTFLVLVGMDVVAYGNSLAHYVYVLLSYTLITCWM
jgi:hypothetical protein